MDGTLIDAWAYLKSFMPKGESPDDHAPPDDPGKPSVDFRGEKRSNRTHQSTTDPEARLMRKSEGDKARLAYSLNALVENRNGLLVAFRVTEANPSDERDTAVEMLEQSLPGSKRLALAGLKAYDTHKFVALCCLLTVTPFK